MVRAVPIPGLFVTGTDTEVGKTMIAGAIAHWFRSRGAAVAVSKPCATGCERRREGLVSEDAEFLAACADARFPLDVICPERYAEPLAPAVAAERAGRPLDYESIDRSMALMSAESDVMIVEGVGGIRVPLDPKHTVIDLAGWLKLPAVIVARAGLGTISHTLLTADCLRAAKIPIAGIIINRYPATSAGVAEETNLKAIEKWSRLPVLCVAPDEPAKRPHLPPGVIAAIDTVDWWRIIRSL